MAHKNDSLESKADTDESFVEHNYSSATTGPHKKGRHLTDIRKKRTTVLLCVCSGVSVGKTHICVIPTVDCVMVMLLHT